MSTTSPSSTTPSNVGNSSAQTQDESASGFLWEFTVLTILWMVFIALLVLLGVIGCQKVRRRHHQSAKDGAAIGWHARTLSITVGVCLVVAIILSIAPHATCKFIYTRDDADLNINLEAMGIWRLLREDSDAACRPYPMFAKEPYYQEGSSVRATRTLSVMATVFGGVAVFYSFLACSFAWSQKFVPLPLCCIAILQASTLVLLQSPVCDELTCELAEGSLSSLTSAAYWLLAAWGISLQEKSLCATVERTSTTDDQEPQVADP